jgi:nitrate/nitrite transporter NarK
VLVDRLGGYRVMLVGLTFSTLGMLLLTRLGEGSGYASLVVPLIIFGFGNGLAFVPLTTTALDGVDPRDAGAASGLVNVMQQVGGSLGLAVLVTVFGSASKSAAASLPAGLSPSEAARRVFVTAADRSFWTATAFLAGTLLLVALLIRPGRRAADPIPVPQVPATATRG